MTQLVPFALLAVLLPSAALAEQTVTIRQSDRMFQPDSVTIAAGDTLRFVNADQFDHQVFTDSPGFSFDTDEIEPGQQLDMRFPKPGVYVVRCHIHPLMRLTVTVR